MSQMLAGVGGVASSHHPISAAPRLPMDGERSPQLGFIESSRDESTVTISDAQSREAGAAQKTATYNDPRVQERQKLERTIDEKQEHQQQQEIQALAQRDREVRAHEQAHAAVGGQYAGAPSYQFQRGPDGVSYAVSGEVPISTGKEATPEETLRKAQVVRRAALAPAEPSPQDRKVAAQASRLEAEARVELAQQQQQLAEQAGQAHSSASVSARQSSNTPSSEVSVAGAVASASESRREQTQAPEQPSVWIKPLDIFTALDRPSPGANVSQMA